MIKTGIVVFVDWSAVPFGRARIDRRRGVGSGYLRNRSFDRAFRRCGSSVQARRGRRRFRL